MIIIDKQRCTACGACVQSCPKKCITMEHDEEGFWFPKINEQECTNCGKCNKVCQLINIDIESRKFQQRAYAVVNKSRRDLLEESSGGAFGALAKNILSCGGIIYGCTINGFEAKHIRISSLDELNTLFGSKYIQSNTYNTYFEAKSDLDNGLPVLYSGTPCQIVGLKCYLGKNYENLLLVDIVCHGVPSDYQFAKMMEWIEKKNNIKIDDIKFRDKSKKGTYSGLIISEDGRKIDYAYFDYYFYYYYLHGLISRQSCYQCQYANLDRKSDITIGDFWGVEGFQLKLDISKGCSLVIVNTQKGQEYLDKTDVNIEEISLNSAVKINEQLLHPVAIPKTRNTINHQMVICSAEENQRIFLRKYFFCRMICKVKYSLPKRLIGLVQKVRYGNFQKNLTM